MPGKFLFKLPALQQYSDYLLVDKAFTDEDLEKINAMWDAGTAQSAPISGEARYNDMLRRSSVVFIDMTAENIWLYQKLMPIVEAVNNNHYHFDILGFYEDFQLIEYNKGDFFNWHMDFGPAEISHRKLSFTIQLTDQEAYTGGDLQFLINEKEVAAPRERGTVVVFPSFMTHRVTPVIRGTRRAIVGWVTGPPYK